MEKEPIQFNNIVELLEQMVHVDQTMRQKCHTDPSAYDETIDHRPDWMAYYWKGGGARSFSCVVIGAACGS